MSTEEALGEDTRTLLDYLVKKRLAIQSTRLSTLYFSFTHHFPQASFQNSSVVVPGDTGSQGLLPMIPT